MPIDTANERRSIAGFSGGVYRIPPVPDGEIAGVDKQHLAIPIPIEVTIVTVVGGTLVEVGLTHYEAPESVQWHIQIEITTAGDPGFATPLIQKDSQLNQANWAYRLDGHGTDGNLVTSMGASGVPTDLDTGRGDDKRVATAFYRLSAAELSLLTEGKTYWIRSRQSANQGVTWGDWFVNQRFMT